MRHISCEELSDLIATKQELTLIDVRSPAEHKAAHIPGSINIPMEQLFENHATLFVPIQKNIIIYCNIGVKSVHTITALEHLDASLDLINLKGGITEWIEGGYYPKIG